MMEYKTLDEYLMRDPLNDHDITGSIRNGLAAHGVPFDSITWLGTEEIVEASIKPLRDEIKRLRELLTNTNGGR